jgi:hypothetical protein
MSFSFVKRDLLNRKENINIWFTLTLFATLTVEAGLTVRAVAKILYLTVRLKIYMMFM